MARFNYQFAKTDTLASQMAAGATSATLSSGNFDTMTADYLVIDYNVPAKREVIKCNVSGTAVTSATRGVEGSDVTHSAGAAVAYAFLPDHAEFLSTGVEDGWVVVNETWVYASASTFTIAGVDLTTKYSKGAKLRFKQGGGFKYAIVASSAFATDTTVTIIVNTDYTIANSAITDNAYSYAENPQGWPHEFTWSPTLANLTLGDGSVLAEYSCNNRTVRFRFVFTLGSTSAVGTAPTFTLPVASTSGYPTRARVGVGAMRDNNTAAADMVAALLGNTTTIELFTEGAGLANITSTAPWTWATSDTIFVQGFYEMA